MYKQKDIVLVPFPYSDLSSSKRRPVLVLSNDNYNNAFPDILVCAITSNLFQDAFSVALNDNDLESGIMPERSIIKCHKLFTIEKSRVLKKFSVVSQPKFSEVVEKVKELTQPAS